MLVDEFWELKTLDHWRVLGCAVLKGVRTKIEEKWANTRSTEVLQCREDVFVIAEYCPGLLYYDSSFSGCEGLFFFNSTVPFGTIVCVSLSLCSYLL